MCGIAGYVGRRDAVATAMESLLRLEYRGYDSAGVAYATDRGIEVHRCPGKVRDLIASLEEGINAQAAIAHTRWATHGAPTERNAHPHQDCSNRFAVVHNGIIENHAVLRAQLRERGHIFTSETDTEVAAHLIEERLAPGAAPHDLARVLQSLMEDLNGSFALGVVCRDWPESIVALRHESPLILGRARTGHMLASDLPALIGRAEESWVLEDGDTVVLTPYDVVVTARDGRPRAPGWEPITLDATSAERAGYEHFMLKEIHEAPAAVRETLRGRLDPDGRVVLSELPDAVIERMKWGHVHFVACGTAYHAGLYGQRLFRSCLGRRAEASVASEFRYDEPLVDHDSVVVLISQSGETADTLAAAKEAKRRGATTVAVVNCVGSSLARTADAALMTRAGPEIGVASTKAYTAQITALAALGTTCGCECLSEDLPRLASAVETVLTGEDRIRDLAEALYRQQCFFFLGRGYDAAAAAEAALKLKEISYIHAEAYPAGEMKHGPLALIDASVTVVGICTRSDTHLKMCSNLMEARARDGRVLAVLRDDLPVPEAATDVLTLPSVAEPLMPVVAMTALQLLAYHIARLRGCAIDQPRNLAKSVTVE